jgi:hypothetical protein
VLRKPNPRRVAAGRVNRAKRGPLTAEGRERLRAAALANKPWLSSTGPKTTEGKKATAENGRHDQMDSLSIRQARIEVADLLALVRTVAEPSRPSNDLVD